jgi:Zinc carboxypeptidase
MSSRSTIVCFAAEMAPAAGGSGRPCRLGRSTAAAGLVLGLLAAAPPGSAQTKPEGRWYTVAGERHGPSFFARVRYPEVEYEIADTLRFDRYHTAEVVYGWLRRWVTQYPELIEVSEVGRSFEGRPILLAAITNRRTGSPLDKPAALFEGGRHSGEITGSESVLWLARHLLTSYGRDSAITRLLDTRTIYLRPENNPDGSGLFLHTAQRNRSTVRPFDDDHDGLVDEDPDDDLDGDGVIGMMRWRVGPGRGNAIQDPRDSTGRLMRPVPMGEGDWRLAAEGIDNDGDGRINEDGIGGLDLHRNYLENWRPERGADSTGRGYSEDGAGAYPLSEPETRSLVLWLLEHPHVSVVNSMDTPIGIHLRPPSTSGSDERMFPEDLAYYRRFDTLGMRITGYPAAGDVYLTANAFLQNLRGGPGSTEPFRPVPTFGHGPDFGYFYYGAIWYGDELWSRGYHEDVNGDGRRDELDALLWDQRDNGGRGFRRWNPVQHPTLGPVELGGFHPKFFVMNPPPAHLEAWARKQALFNLALARQLPLLELLGVDRRLVARSADTADYEVTVRWKNSGGLPTALRQARLVKIVREDEVALELQTPGGEAAPSAWIVEPRGRGHTVYAGWTEPGEIKMARFRVRVVGPAPVGGVVHLRSTRGGLLRAAVTLP